MCFAASAKPCVQQDFHWVALDLPCSFLSEPSGRLSCGKQTPEAPLVVRLPGMWHVDVSQHHCRCPTLTFWLIVGYPGAGQFAAAAPWWSGPAYKQSLLDYPHACILSVFVRDK